MTTILITCRQCGREFAPDHRAIVAAAWRLWRTCAPKSTEPSHCRECGRPLAGNRDLRLQCLGVPL